MKEKKPIFWKKNRNGKSIPTKENNTVVFDRLTSKQLLNRKKSKAAKRARKITYKTG